MPPRAFWSRYNFTAICDRTPSARAWGTYRGHRFFDPETRHRYRLGALQGCRAWAFAQAVLDLVEAQNQVAGEGSGLHRALLLQRRDSYLVEPRYGVAGDLDDGVQGLVESWSLVQGPRGFGDD